MIKVILCSAVVSIVISFVMMKFHMRMTEKWIDEFFEKEEEYIKKNMLEMYERGKHERKADQ